MTVLKDVQLKDVPLFCFTDNCSTLYVMNVSLCTICFHSSMCIVSQSQLRRAPWDVFSRHISTSHDVVQLFKYTAFLFVCHDLQRANNRIIEYLASQSSARSVVDSKKGKSFKSCKKPRTHGSLSFGVVLKHPEKVPPVTTSAA